MVPIFFLFKFTPDWCAVYMTCVHVLQRLRCARQGKAKKIKRANPIRYYLRWKSGATGLNPWGCVLVLLEIMMCLGERDSGSPLVDSYCESVRKTKRKEKSRKFSKAGGKGLGRRDHTRAVTGSGKKSLGTCCP